MKTKAAFETITAVGFSGRWVKLLQAARTETGPTALLGLQAKRLESLSEEEAALGLKELVKKLPKPAREVVGLIPGSEVLTRYLLLPSKDPQELRSMALYQLEGLLPFSIQECVISIQVIDALAESTRVLAVAVHKPSIERILRICRRCGLTVTEVTTTAEVVGRWHQLCEKKPSAQAWVTADLTAEGLDLGIWVKGSLVYLRHVSHIVWNFDELLAQLKETLQAYTKERVGPPVELVTLSGDFEPLGLGAVERLETALAVSVHRIDLLEVSPFREALIVRAKELAPEISFTELLGAACLPRLAEISLLPLEAQWEQARALFLQQLRRTGLWAAVGVVLVSGWVLGRAAQVWLQIKQVNSQIAVLEPQVDRIQEMVSEIRQTAEATALYAAQMEWLAQAVKPLSAGMFLQSLGLEGTEDLVLRGVAPDLKSVTGYASELRQDPHWGKVVLRSTKSRQKGSKAKTSLEFELLLKPKSKPVRGEIR